MKIIVWNSREKREADYQKLMKGCDVLCLVECGQWDIPQKARQIQSGLFYWKKRYGDTLYDLIYSSQGLAFICREGWYGGEAVTYCIHSAIGTLAGICLQGNFWLFANHEANVANSYHIGEFYLREISARFQKAALVADFKEENYSWTQETIGILHSVPLPSGYHPLTVNYLFTIHVACKDRYLIKGYDNFSNQPTFFELEI